MLSRTKSAAFLLHPQSFKGRDQGESVYALKVLLCLGALLGYCISQQNHCSPFHEESHTDGLSGAN